MAHDGANSPNTGANETGANETGANETGANETGANHTGSNHTGSNHTGTNHSGTNHSGSTRESTRQPLRSDPIELARANWTHAGWTAASDPMGVVTSVMRAHQLLLGEVDRVLRPLGLTFARYEVLMLLHFSRAGALPVGKIGARLQVHPASVTNAVDRLEADALVARHPHPDDGRSVMAEITPEGRAVALRATEALNADVFERLPVNATAQRELIADLQELRRAFGDFA